MLGYLSQIERAPGPDSGAIRHVPAILGHRWQAGTTAPRQLGLHTMTHTEGRVLMDAYMRADYVNFWHFKSYKRGKNVM